MTRPGTPGKLTGHERAAIDAIRWLAARGQQVRLSDIAERTGQTIQGAGAVLASAERKALVWRSVGRGHVWYALTTRGWALAAPRTRQARRVTR